MEKREPAEIARELNLRLPLEEVSEESHENPAPDVAADNSQMPHTAEIIHLGAAGDHIQSGDDERETS